MTKETSVGLFDNLLNNSFLKDHTLTAAEAFAAITLAATASDGYLSDSEVQTLSLSLSRMKLFQDYSDEATAKMLDRFLSIIRNENGNDLFTRAKQYLPHDLRETAFAVATDLILADGLVTDEEKIFLEQLHRSLEIPDNTALDIVRVILIKNKG
jgi:uncharacterized tellurite resistance protein B-like protein